jgi:uncharacterized membrane protein YedE/YeeE
VGAMENFTPVSGFVGGLLIGGAASLLVLMQGRIAGISGILGGLFGAAATDLAWRLAFVAGIVIGPVVVGLLGGRVPEIGLQASLPVLVVAGLLVGFGTRLGGGCTSGHGVCGLARGSPRSFIATGVFFAVAVLTVFIARHVVAG